MERLKTFIVFLKLLEKRVDAELRYFIPSSIERYDFPNKRRK